MSSFIHNTSVLGSADDDAGPDADRNVVVVEAQEDVSVPLAMVEAEQAADRQSLWPTSLRRLLSTSTCRKVTTTYDCNCRCVQPVPAKACHISCVPYWRSFIPIRMSLPLPTPGFYADDKDTTATAALAGYQAVLAVNATSAAFKAEHEATVNRTDTAKLVELAEVFTPDGYGTATPLGHEGYGRTLTLRYEHWESRRRAVDHMHAWHFAPGMVSECFFDPLMRPGATVVKAGDGGMVYFGHEMGFTLWKWMLLLLLALATALSCYQCLLEGEVIKHDTSMY